MFSSVADAATAAYKTQSLTNNVPNFALIYGDDGRGSWGNLGGLVALLTRVPFHLMNTADLRLIAFSRTIP